MQTLLKLFWFTFVTIFLFKKNDSVNSSKAIVSINYNLMRSLKNYFERAFIKVKKRLKI
jgi:hypothetical protein